MTAASEKKRNKGTTVCEKKRKGTTVCEKKRKKGNYARRRPSRACVCWDDDDTLWINTPGNDAGSGGGKGWENDGSGSDGGVGGDWRTHDTPAEAQSGQTGQRGGTSEADQRFRQEESPERHDEAPPAQLIAEHMGREGQLEYERQDALIAAQTRRQSQQDVQTLAAAQEADRGGGRDEDLTRRMEEAEAERAGAISKDLASLEADHEREVRQQEALRLRAEEAVMEREGSRLRQDELRHFDETRQGAEAAQAETALAVGEALAVESSAAEEAEERRRWVQAAAAEADAALRREEQLRLRGDEAVRLFQAQRQEGDAELKRADTYATEVRGRLDDAQEHVRQRQHSNAQQLQAVVEDRSLRRQQQHAALRAHQARLAADQAVASAAEADRERSRLQTAADADDVEAAATRALASAAEANRELSRFHDDSKARCADCIARGATPESYEQLRMQKGEAMRQWENDSKSRGQISDQLDEPHLKDERYNTLLATYEAAHNKNVKSMAEYSRLKNAVDEARSCRKACDAVERGLQQQANAEHERARTPQATAVTAEQAVAEEEAAEKVASETLTLAQEELAAEQAVAEEDAAEKVAAATRRLEAVQLASRQADGIMQNGIANVAQAVVEDRNLRRQQQHAALQAHQARLVADQAGREMAMSRLRDAEAERAGATSNELASLEADREREVRRQEALQLRAEEAAMERVDSRLRQDELYQQQNYLERHFDETRQGEEAAQAEAALAVGEADRAEALADEALATEGSAAEEAEERRRWVQAAAAEADEALRREEQLRLRGDEAARLFQAQRLRVQDGETELQSADTYATEVRGRLDDAQEHVRQRQAAKTNAVDEAVNLARQSRSQVQAAGAGFSSNAEHVALRDAHGVATTEVHEARCADCIARGATPERFEELQRQARGAMRQFRKDADAAVQSGLQLFEARERGEEDETLQAIAEAAEDAKAKAAESEVESSRLDNAAKEARLCKDLCDAAEKARRRVLQRQATAEEVRIRRAQAIANTSAAADERRQEQQAVLLQFTKEQNAQARALAEAETAVAMGRLREAEAERAGAISNELASLEADREAQALEQEALRLRGEQAAMGAADLESRREEQQRQQADAIRAEARAVAEQRQPKLHWPKPELETPKPKRRRIEDDKPAGAAETIKHFDRNAWRKCGNEECTDLISRMIVFNNGTGKIRDKVDKDYFEAYKMVSQSYFTAARNRSSVNWKSDIPFVTMSHHMQQIGYDVLGTLKHYDAHPMHRDDAKMQAEILEMLGNRRERFIRVSNDTPGEAAYLDLTQTNIWEHLKECFECATFSKLFFDWSRGDSKIRKTERAHGRKYAFEDFVVHDDPYEEPTDYDSRFSQVHVNFNHFTHGLHDRSVYADMCRLIFFMIEKFGMDGMDAGEKLEYYDRGEPHGLLQ